MPWIDSADPTLEIEPGATRLYDRSFVVLIVALAVLVPVSVLAGWRESAISAAVCLSAAIGLWVLARRGRRHLAGLLALLMVLGLLFAEMWRSEGIHNIALAGYPAVIALAALLLSRLWFVLVAGLSILAVAVLAVAEMQGRLPSSHAEGVGWSELAVVSLILVAAAVVVDAQATGLRRSLRSAHRNEQARRIGEQRFRALVENLSEAIGVLDAEGGLRYVSPAVRGILGRPPEALIGSSLLDLVHDDDRAAASAFLGRMIEQPGSRERARLRLRHRDESWRVIDLGGQSLLDLPSVRGMVLSLRDVTEQQRASEALQASERKFSLTFDVNPHPMGISSLVDGRMIDVNARFLETFGYARDEVLGRVASEVGWVAAEDRRRIVELLEERGSMRDEELTLRTRTGASRVLLLSAEPIELDGEPCMLVASTDITERKRAEQVLRESEQRLLRMFHANPTAMALSSLEDGRVLDVNRAMAELVGWERDQLLGKSGAELGNWSDEGERARILEELRASRSAPAREVRMRGRDGRELVWMLSAELFELDGRRCALWSAVDVTENKRLAEQLQRSQKLEALGRLAGGVAHDFNNWITPIVGYSELLLESLDRDDERRSMALEIHQAGKRASELAMQLLRFGRGEGGRPSALDVNELVLALAPLLRRMLGAEVELATRLSPGLDLVWADPTQLEQVILNLALNGRDAMPGGGRLTIETSIVEVGSGARRPGERLGPGAWVALAITDGGSGMDAETLGRIFEPFFTTKEEGKGTGLGLPTVYGIVARSGGEIEVSSELGRGTAVTVFLPAHREDAAATGS